MKDLLDSEALKEVRQWREELGQEMGNIEDDAAFAEFLAKSAEEMRKYQEEIDAQTDRVAEGTEPYNCP